MVKIETMKKIVEKHIIKPIIATINPSIIKIKSIAPDPVVQPLGLKMPFLYKLRYMFNRHCMVFYDPVWLL